MSKNYKLTNSLCHVPVCNLPLCQLLRFIAINNAANYQLLCVVYSSLDFNWFNRFSARFVLL